MQAAAEALMQAAAEALVHNEKLLFSERKKVLRQAIEDFSVSGKKARKLATLAGVNVRTMHEHLKLNPGVSVKNIRTASDILDVDICTLRAIHEILTSSDKGRVLESRFAEGVLRTAKNVAEEAATFLAGKAAEAHDRTSAARISARIACVRAAKARKASAFIKRHLRKALEKRENAQKKLDSWRAENRNT